MKPKPYILFLILLVSISGAHADWTPLGWLSNYTGSYQIMHNFSDLTVMGNGTSNLNITNECWKTSGDMLRGSRNATCTSGMYYASRYFPSQNFTTGNFSAGIVVNSTPNANMADYIRIDAQGYGVGIDAARECGFTSDGTGALQYFNGLTATAMPTPISGTQVQGMFLVVSVDLTNDKCNYYVYNASTGRLNQSVNNKDPFVTTVAQPPPHVYALMGDPGASVIFDELRAWNNTQGYALPNQSTPITQGILFYYPTDESVISTFTGMLNFSTVTASSFCSINNSIFTLSANNSPNYVYQNSSATPEGLYHINVSCEPSGGGANYSDVLNFYYDTTSPSFTTSLEGNGTYASLNLTMNVTATDTNLKNLTVSGSCISGYSNASTSANPYFQSLFFNTTSCSINNYTATVKVCDLAENCYSQDFLWYNRAALKIRAFDYTGLAIVNFSIYRDGSTLLASTMDNQTSIINLTNATINLSINAPGYSIANSLINVNKTAAAYNFSLFLTNTIHFYFRDEETLALLSGHNVTAELISTAFANNYSTTNGTLFVELLVPSTYSVRYVAPSYGERFYFFTLENQSYNNLTLYLLSNTSGTAVTAFVLDESNRRLEDAYIKVLKYDLLSNDYLLREIAKTNFEGETRLSLVLNSEFYKFVIEYPLGTVRQITSGSYIYQDEITFQIQTNTPIADNFYKSNDVSYDLDFIDASNTFRYIYSDTNNILQEGCMKVYKLSAHTNSELINETCSTGSSASMNIDVVNQSGVTYEAQVFVNFGSGPYYLASLTKEYDVQTPTGILGIWLLIIITIVIFFGALYMSVAVALILLPLPTLAMAVMGLVDISITAVIGVEIVMIIIAFMISRGER